MPLVGGAAHGQLQNCKAVASGSTQQQTNTASDGRNLQVSSHLAPSPPIVAKLAAGAAVARDEAFVPTHGLRVAARIARQALTGTCTREHPVLIGMAALRTAHQQGGREDSRAAE